MLESKSSFNHKVIVWQHRTTYYYIFFRPSAIVAFLEIDVNSFVQVRLHALIDQVLNSDPIDLGAVYSNGR